ncbi:MAG TPA: hypothetical protein VF945_01265 [Polyangia bacterium]
MSGRAPARATLALPHTLVLVATVALVLVAGGAPARAKVTLQATTAAAVGWTDNVLNAPDELIPMGPARESDFFFQLVPGAVLSSASPRLLQRLAYNFTADLFVHHSEANSYSNSLEWAGDVATSKTTNLLLTAQTQQGRISTFNLNQQSSGTTIAVLPQNANINFFSQNVTESLDWTPTGKWRVSQLALFRAFIPTDRGVQPDVYEAQGDLAFDRLFRLDSLGMLLRESFIDYEPPRDPMTDVPVGFSQKQVLTTLLGRWRRDWSPSWSSEAALGAVNAVGVSNDPMAPNQTAWEPSALAAIRYARELAIGELRYAHDVTPNPLAGSTFSTDEAALQAGLPIVRAKMFLGATAAYQFARQLPLLAGVQRATAHVALVDFTIGWQPRPEVGVFARYSLYDQFGAKPVGTVPATLPDLTRNTVLVGVNVIYPAVAAARVPSRLGTRVDRSDQPGFPEMHAPQQR